MNAYYNKIEAPIEGEIGMTLYGVYYEAIRGDGRTCGSVYKLIGVYEREETAIAVVNAIKGGLL